MGVLGLYNKFMEKWERLKEKLRKFAEERDWEKYHSPKNLAISIAVEVGELLEHFQWISEDESRNLPDEKKSDIAEEMADVFLYLTMLADKLGINLFEAAFRKIEKNEEKYPAEKVRGSSKKYTEY